MSPIGWLRLLVLLGSVLLDQAAAQSRSSVLTVKISGEAITPVTARFLERSIQEAEESGAECLIIVLDTPGGLVDSTRQIVGAILRSRVPVVVYVAPPGARAASAGVFLAMAAHVSAMAPGTNIGAAHPVAIGGAPAGPPPAPEPKNGKKDEPPRGPSPAEEKAVNDTAAWARSLAEMRGRNADWVESAVRQSIAASATEAVNAGAVDLLAGTLDDLLQKIDGRQVVTTRGSVTLRTAGAESRTREMWWGERILASLANPTIAFLLLMFGFYGILFELYTPGWGVPGTIGAICLALGFFALSVLPVNIAGLMLIFIALALFIAEAFVPSFGFLTIGGVVCLILGGLMLVDSPAGFLRISLWTVVPVAVATAAITVFLVTRVIQAHRTPVRTGGEAMAGAAAVADGDFIPDGGSFTGMVRTHGELWKAISPEPVAAGDRLEVVSRDDLTLLVRRPGPDGPRMVSDQRSVA